MLPGKKTVIIIASFLNALLMAGFTFFWLRQPYWSGDEFTLIRYTSVLKRLVLPLDDFPPRSRFLFVTVSWDKQLIEKTDKDGFLIGYQTITNRKKLAQFFSVLNKKPGNHKFVICDIFFKDTSPDDSVLVRELKSLPNVLCSYHKDENDRPDYPLAGVPGAISDYETTENGTCVKFKMMQNDSLKSLPLLMYEKLYHTRFREGAICDTLNDSPVLNSFILDYRIRSHQLQEDTFYSKVYMGEELLLLPEEEIHALTKDRIIILGDFEDRDVHETVYGKMPGSLILLNAFLAIEAGENRLSIWFLVFILAGYTLISYRAFYGNNRLERWLEALAMRSKWMRMFSGVISYALVLVLMSVVSYFLFNIHLTILLLALYINLVEKTIQFFKRKMVKKAVSTPKVLIEHAGGAER